jgi:hypothetical protein
MSVPTYWLLSRLFHYIYIDSFQNVSTINSINMHNNYSSSKTLHNEDGRHTSLKNKDICVGGFMSYLRYLCIVVFSSCVLYVVYSTLCCVLYVVYSMLCIVVFSSCVLYVDSFSGLLAMFDYLFRILSTFIIYFG